MTIGAMGREIRGTIPSDGVVSLLRSFEENRTSGLLVFRAPDGTRGEVWLRLGHVDTGAPAPHDGHDPVERFLGLRGGSYELLDRLPPLDDSEGSERIRAGSLDRHSIADLMNYSEAAGLSGLIRVERAERVAEIVYKNGSLDAIYLDGDESAVDEVFGWSEGRFTIRIEGTPSMFPRDGANDGRPEPRIIERQRGDVLDEAAQRRPRAASIPPPPRAPAAKREGTVRIVLLGGQGEALVSLPSAKAGAEARAREAQARPEARPDTPRVANRAIERRASRAHGARSGELEQEPLMPRTAVVVLALVLFSGLAAFVAVLMRIS